jgi:hypothetical protein
MSDLETLASRPPRLPRSATQLSIALPVSADVLVFDTERDSDEELRLDATQLPIDEDKETR